MVQTFKSWGDTEAHRQEGESTRLLYESRPELLAPSLSKLQTQETFFEVLVIPLPLYFQIS
jgi:hypothetical protein